MTENFFRTLSDYEKQLKLSRRLVSFGYEKQIWQLKK